LGALVRRGQYSNFTFVQDNSVSAMKWKTCLTLFYMVSNGWAVSCLLSAVFSSISTNGPRAFTADAMTTKVEGAMYTHKIHRLCYIILIIWFRSTAIISPIYCYGSLLSEGLLEYKYQFWSSVNMSSDGVKFYHNLTVFRTVLKIFNSPLSHSYAALFWSFLPLSFQ